MPDLRITRRRLPHWTLEGSTYFATFRVVAGTLTAADIRIVLDHIKSGHPLHYILIAASVMPDHVHLLIRPSGDMPLGRVMKGIKGVSARLINQARGTQGKVWQDESWDRIIRDQAELDEKLSYMLNNPLRDGLVDDPWQYPGWFLNVT